MIISRSNHYLLRHVTTWLVAAVMLANPLLLVSHSNCGCSPGAQNPEVNDVCCCCRTPEPDLASANSCCSKPSPNSASISDSSISGHLECNRLSGTIAHATCHCENDCSCRVGHSPFHPAPAIPYDTPTVRVIQLMLLVIETEAFATHQAVSGHNYSTSSSISISFTAQQVCALLSRFIC